MRIHVIRFKTFKRVDLVLNIMHIEKDFESVTYSHNQQHILIIG